MTKDRNQFRDGLTDDGGAGWINRFLAEEDELDGHSTWRLASWGVGTVGALVVAVLAIRSPAATSRDQLASAELARQSQQVQWIARESQNKARELAAAVETLNGDRDRLYARVTVLEQGLDSVTGSLARPSTAAASPQTTQPAAALPSPPPSATPPVSTQVARTDSAAPPEAKGDSQAQLPKIAPVATAPAAPSPAAKAADPKTETPTTQPAAATTASVAPQSQPQTEMPTAALVRKTEFGIDLGGANSVEGLRALWRGAIKTSSQQIGSLQPIIVVKERTDGLGMQLRLVAGPLSDAAEAAKVCAAMLTESNRACDTSVYDGQRLSMIADKPEARKPEGQGHRSKRRGKQRSEQVEDQPKSSSVTSFFR